MLAGGILAQGVRPRLTREDFLWEKAAWADGFFERYGWTLEELEAQPDWLTERLPGIWQIKAENEKERAERA